MMGVRAPSSMRWSLLFANFAFTIIVFLAEWTSHRHKVSSGQPWFPNPTERSLNCVRKKFMENNQVVSLGNDPLSAMESNQDVIAESSLASDFDSAYEFDDMVPEYLTGFAYEPLVGGFGTLHHQVSFDDVGFPSSPPVSASHSSNSARPADDGNTPIQALAIQGEKGENNPYDVTTEEEGLLKIGKYAYETEAAFVFCPLNDEIFYMIPYEGQHVQEQNPHQIGYFPGTSYNLWKTERQMSCKTPNPDHTGSTPPLAALVKSTFKVPNSSWKLLVVFGQKVSFLDVRLGQNEEMPLKADTLKADTDLELTIDLGGAGRVPTIIAKPKPSSNIDYDSLGWKGHSYEGSHEGKKVFIFIRIPDDTSGDGVDDEDI